MQKEQCMIKTFTEENFVMKIVLKFAADKSDIRFDDKGNCIDH